MGDGVHSLFSEAEAVGQEKGPTLGGGEERGASELDMGGGFGKSKSLENLKMITLFLL